jgi:hypothetical protein
MLRHPILALEEERAGALLIGADIETEERGSVDLPAIFV